MPHRRLNTRVALALLAVLTCAASGCVHRRMTIRTDPPGALVEVDGERLGLTPVSTDFLYYGTREITMSAPGYETLVVPQRVPPPWYQVFPLEFFA
ncbi:MAG: PEGA domain-containing protein, partial [Pirellulales bacterium]